jgi:hypothetical protein
MKRVLICAVLVVAVVLPATTAAGVRSFRGPVKPDGSIEFRVKVRHGKLARVKGSPTRRGFTWKSIPIECETGSLPGDVMSGYFPFSIKVKNRRFHARGANNHAIASVRGKFRKHGRRARGTIRIHGDFPRYMAWNCDTTRDYWRAHRVPD